MDLRKHHRRTAKIGADCVACGCCVKACPVQAVQVVKGIMAKVDWGRCVGCGRCVKECPASVISLQEVKA